MAAQVGAAAARHRHSTLPEHALSAGESSVEDGPRGHHHQAWPPRARPRQVPGATRSRGWLVAALAAGALLWLAWRHAASPAQRGWGEGCGSPAGMWPGKAAGNGAPPLPAASVAQLGARGSAVRERYLEAVLCKGFCNQLMALQDAAALAFLLNATLVLPDFYTGYDFFASDRLNFRQISYHPQAKLAVPFASLFDAALFKASLAPELRVVAALPAELRGEDGFARRAPLDVDPRRPDGLAAAAAFLAEHAVLRLRCPLHTVKWNTHELMWLRSALWMAMAPSKEMRAAVEAQKQQAGLPAGQPFAAVHLRTEADWWHYCHSEPRRPLVSQVTTFEECYVAAPAVAAYLAREAALPRTTRLYVIGGNVTGADLDAFRAEGFLSVHRGIPGGQLEPSMRDHYGAVEWFLALDARTAFGNIFSSFDWLQRDRRRVRAHGGWQTAYYYNRPPEHAQGELSPVESLRWLVFPRPHAPQAAASSAEGDGAGGALPRRGTCDELASISLSGLKSKDNGHVELRVELASGCPLCMFHIEVYADGRRVLAELSNSIRVAAAAAGGGGLRYSMGLDATVALPSAEYRAVTLEACCRGGEPRMPGAPGLCSPRELLQHKPALQRLTAAALRGPPPPGRILLHTSVRSRTGGPEALHQLHHVLNQLALTGFLTMGSVFPEGNAAYATEFSNFSEPLAPWDIGPHDVVIVPEYGDSLRDVAAVMRTVGTLGAVWHLGQLRTPLALDKADKADFRPLCLTQYFASTQACAPKAIINPPMASAFVDEARRWRQAPRSAAKEELVLYDPDAPHFFDPTRVRLPPGAQLVPLAGFSRAQVIRLYKRAKVVVDSFLTGCERALFEAALFDVVPIIAEHGPGRDASSFPIPERWTWKLWDYDQLNQLLHDALTEHDKSLRSFQPFVEHTLGLESSFVQQASNYFGDDVLFVISALSDVAAAGLSGPISSAEDRAGAVLSALALMHAHPFADVEVVVENVKYFEFDYAGFFDALMSLGMQHNIRVTEILPEYRRFKSSAVFFQPPETAHRRRFAVLLPTPGALLLSRGLLSRMLRRAHQAGNHVLHHPASGLLLVDWWHYFSRVQETLPIMPNATLAPHVMQAAAAMGLSVDTFAEDRSAGSVAWMGRTPTACLSDAECRAIKDMTQGPLWKGVSSRIPYGSRHAGWLQEATGVCAGSDQ